MSIWTAAVLIRRGQRFRASTSSAVGTGQLLGTLTRITGDLVPVYLSLKMSPHEIGLPDMLLAAKLRDLYPEEVVVWGVQPATMEVGLDLSPLVAPQLDVLVERVLEELARWEVSIQRIPPAA